MSNKGLSDIFQQQRETERAASLKASDAVVKPDTRKLPPSRVGKKQVATWVSSEGHKEVRIAALMQGCSVEDFLRDALNTKLVEMGRPPIA